MRKIVETKSFILDRPLYITWRYYVKRILLPFFDLLYRFVLKMNRPLKTKKKYNVSLCGIFKDEAANLTEWIEYHKLVGVEHFYLYNNFSCDDYFKVLEPYIEKGLVTLTDWPLQQGQMKAYENCINVYGSESQWISFLDIDEFFVPCQETSLNTWLKKFEKYHCVLVYWKMFGTSGRVQHDPKKLITEQYTVCWPKLDNIGKVFWNTNYAIADYASMHIMYGLFKVFKYSLLIPPVNQFGKFVRWDIHRVGAKHSGDVAIQINHYWSKSYEDMVIKKFNRGDAFFGDEIPTRNISTFLLHEHQNKSVDYKIYRFLIELKIAMGMMCDIRNDGK